MAIIPLEEFKKAAPEIFREDNELFKAYQDYESTKGSNNDAEYSSLKTLLGEVNGFLQKPLNADIKISVDQLKEQIVERRYEVWHEQQAQQIKEGLSQAGQAHRQWKKVTFNESLIELQNIVGKQFNTATELLTALDSRYSGAAGIYVKSQIRGVIDISNKLTIGSLRAATSLLLSPEFSHFQKALNLVKLNPNSPVNEQGRMVVAQELAKYPPEILDLMNAHDIRVTVTHDNITTYYQHLKGVTPRGWPAGQTWDTVPGVGAFDSHRESVISVTLNANGKWTIPSGTHGSSNLVLHETAHAIDRLVGEDSYGEYFSTLKRFDKAWRDDYQILGDEYYRQGGTQAGREETFAEGMAKYYDNAARLSWRNVSDWISNKPFDELAQEYSTDWWKQQLESEFSPKVKAYVEQQVPELNQPDPLNFASLRKIYQAIHDAPFEGQNAPLAVLGQLANQPASKPSVAPPPTPPVKNKHANIDEIRGLVAGKNLTSNTELFQRLGKESLNKNAFRLKGTNWVILAATSGVSESKWRGLHSEVSQLTDMGKAGIPVPDVITQPEGRLFEFTLTKRGREVKAKGFLQQFLSGVEMDKERPNAFGREIAEIIAKNSDSPSEAREKLDSALNDLKRIQVYLADHNIPDFQVFFDENSGRVFVFDPGDPETSGNYQDKYKGWVDKWLHTLETEKPKVMREYLATWQDNQQLIDQFQQRLVKVDPNLQWRPAPQSVLTINAESAHRNGVCAAISTAWAQASYLDAQDGGSRAQQLLDNLFTVGAIRSEELAGPVSDNDHHAASDFLKSLDALNFAQSEGSVLPTGLTDSLGDLTPELLANHLSNQTPTSTETYLLSTRNHTMAITVAHGEDGWDIRLNDPTVGEVTEIKTPQQLQALLQGHLTDLGVEYNLESDSLLVEKMNHQALADSDLNNLITPRFTVIETTIEKLRTQDASLGNVTIGNQEVSRAELYRLGAQIDGRPIDATVDFSNPATFDTLTLRQDKVQAFIKGQDGTTVSKVYQLAEAIAAQRLAAGQSGNVIVKVTSSDHWLLEQHQQLSATRHHFSQAKQVLATAQQQGLTVELAPSGKNKHQPSLIDVLAVAHAEQAGEVQAVLGNRNRAAFVNDLLQQGKANDAERQAHTDFENAQSQLASAVNNNADHRASAGTLTIQAVATWAAGEGDRSLVLKNGNQHFLVSKRNGTLSFYDPSVGWVSGFADGPALQSYMTDYFSDLTKLHYGMATGTFEVNELQTSFFKDPAVTEANAQLKKSLPVEVERLSHLDLQKGPLLIDGQQVSRVTLWQMGAKLNGKPVAAASFEGDWTSKLSFNPKALKQHLRAVPDVDFRQSLEALQVLAKQERIKPVNLVDTDGLSSGLRNALTELDSPNLTLNSAGLKSLRSQIGGRTKISSGAVTNISGVGLQAFGIYSGLKAANDAFKKGELTEGFIQMGAVTAELASIPLEMALERSLPKLGQRLVAYSAGNTGRFAATTSRLGSTLGRSAGAVASLITLPFDIYSAVKAFSDAGAEGLTDKQRQDLYFQGGMSVAGATVSLGLGVASALSATAAAYAGPVGIAVGVAFVVGSQIYSAVRQVEDVMEYVELSDMQRLRQGWLAFWGKDMDQWVTDAFKTGKAEEEYFKRVREQSRNMLNGALGDTVGAIVYGNASAQIKGTKVWDIEGNYTIQRMPEVVGNDDHIDARNGLQPVQNVVHQNPHWHIMRMFGQQIGSEIDPEKAVLFNIGDGRDTAYGMTDRKNMFVFGKGSKQLEGGTLADTFTFSAGQNTISNFAESLNPDGSLKNIDDMLWFRLDGGEGEDTLVLSADTFNRYAREGSAAQRFSGFIVDLEAGKVWLRNNGKSGEAAKGPEIGNFSSIEHTTGSGAGLEDDAMDRGYSDILYGSESSNSLVANYGDQVFARGGDDMVTITDYVTVDGGAGQDVYLIQRGVIDATIKEDGADASVIRFDYSIEEIESWQRQGKDLVVTFKPRHGSRPRTVTVQNVYGETGGGVVAGEVNSGLTLVNDKLSFQTRDGFMLLPQLARTIPPAQADQAESINLTTRYLKTGDQVYRDDPNGITIDLQDNRIDGDNRIGRNRDKEFSNLNKDNLIVLGSDEDHEGAAVGSSFFVERGQGETVIKPIAQDNSTQGVNTIYLDYDVAEISAIQTRYEVEPFTNGHSGYNRKDYGLVLIMVDGRQLVLSNIMDTSTHHGDAQAYEGRTLRDFIIITRDGTEYGLEDRHSFRSNHSSKLLTTERHYDDQRYSGLRLVDTRSALITTDHKLGDWQWGEGRRLNDRYQLSAEGTSGGDKLYGSDDADVMRGYGGDDLMQGREGHDTYVVGGSEGNITINNQALDGKLDSVVLNTAFDQVKTQRAGMDLLITAQLERPLPDGQTETVSREIRIRDYFVSDSFRHLNIVTNEGIQQEVVVDELGNISRLYMASETGDAHLRSDNDGKSMLFGREGNDQLIAGEAGTMAHGGEGNDRLVGVSGNDILLGEDGNDVIELSGGGDDVASGGEGNDSYSIRIDSNGLKFIDNQQVQRGQDELYLEQMTLDNVLMARNGDDLHLLKREGNRIASRDLVAEVVVKNYFLSAEYQHLSLLFADGETLSPHQMLGLANKAEPYILLLEQLPRHESGVSMDYRNHQGGVTSTLDARVSNDQVFYGSDFNDTVKLTSVGNLESINLGLGENTLDFSQLDDSEAITISILEPESRGYQRLYVNGAEVRLDGVKHIVATGNDDEIWGSQAANILSGGEGHDSIYDFAGTNTFIGGKGDDRIHSGGDRDTIIFHKGDNKDTVTGETTGDVLKLNNINLYDVHFSVEDLSASRSLHISFKGQASDQITIKNWQENQAFHITTDDGSVIDKQGIDQLVQSLASFDAEAWSSSSAPIDTQAKTAITSAWTITNS